MLSSSKQLDSGLMSLEETTTPMSDDTQISDDELWRCSPQSESLLTQVVTSQLHQSKPLNLKSGPAVSTDQTHQQKVASTYPNSLVYHQPNTIQDPRHQQSSAFKQAISMDDSEPSLITTFTQSTHHKQSSTSSFKQLGEFIQQKPTPTPDAPHQQSFQQLQDFRRQLKPTFTDTSKPFQVAYPDQPPPTPVARQQKPTFTDASEPSKVYQAQLTHTPDICHQQNSNFNQFKQFCKDEPILRFSNMKSSQLLYHYPTSASALHQPTNQLQGVRQEQTNFSQQFTNLEPSQMLYHFQTSSAIGHQANIPPQDTSQELTNFEPSQRLPQYPTSTSIHRQVTDFNPVSQDVGTNLTQQLINLDPSQILSQFNQANTRMGQGVVPDQTNHSQRFTNLEPSQMMYHYPTPSHTTHQDQPTVAQQSANLDHSQMLYFYQLPSTQAVRNLEQSQLNYQLLEQPRLKQSSTTHQSTNVIQLLDSQQQNVRIPTNSSMPSQLQTLVLVPPTSDIPNIASMLQQRCNQNSQLQLLTEPSVIPNNQLNYQPQIIINNLEKPMPKSEKNHVITNEEKDKTLDDASANNLSTQTPIILPSEQTELSKNVLQHVLLIRGILGAKQFDMLSSCEGGKRASTPDHHHQYPPAIQNKKPKMLKPDQVGQVEVIDLTSSPEPAPPPTTHHHHQATQQLRYALRDSGTEQGIAVNLETLTEYAEKEILCGAEYIAELWTGSLMELCVDTMVRTGRSDHLRAAPILSRFSLNLISAIIHHNQLIGGETLEGISNIILKLSECQSVAVDLVEHMLVILPRHLDQIFKANVSFMSSIRLVENLYHILRILATILTRIKDDIQIFGSLKENKSSDDVNIMNLWRKHWRPAASKTGVAGSKRNSLSPLLSRFLNKLELLMRFSLKHAPLFSPFLAECLQMAQQMHFIHFDTIKLT